MTKFGTKDRFHGWSFDFAQGRHRGLGIPADDGPLPPNKATTSGGAVKALQKLYQRQEVVLWLVRGS